MKKNAFAKVLAEKLKNLEQGEIEIDSLSDGSGSWVQITVGKKVFCFSFDNDGVNLTDICLYKDKGGKLVYGVFKPKPPQPNNPNPEPQSNPQTNVNQRVVTAGFVQYISGTTCA